MKRVSFEMESPLPSAVLCEAAELLRRASCPGFLGVLSIVYRPIRRVGLWLGVEEVCHRQMGLGGATTGRMCFLILQNAL